MIYDDLDPDQINALPDTQFHRNFDLEILKADSAGQENFQMIYIY